METREKLPSLLAFCLFAAVATTVARFIPAPLSLNERLTLVYTHPWVRQLDETLIYVGKEQRLGNRLLSRRLLLSYFL